jgi:TRAP-type C4-dicarboxylate transport system permease small subunit|tara:strand:- start:7931 stop:8428 length:498 start_codon:yes stop_codon:yes gene_type:complete
MSSNRQAIIPRLFKGYAVFEDGVLMLIFASTLALAVMQILLRNFFDIGLIWLESYLRMQVLWLAMLGAMVATREGQHIRIDLLARFIQGRLIRYFDGTVALFSVLVCGAATYACITLVQFEMEDNLMAFGPVPIWVCQLILPFGFAVMTLRFAETARRVIFQGVH